jgi:hypothetical protein
MAPATGILEYSGWWSERSGWTIILDGDRRDETVTMQPNGELRAHRADCDVDSYWNRALGEFEQVPDVIITGVVAAITFVV